MKRIEERLKELIEFVKCPETGSEHFGGWGILAREQRLFLNNLARDTLALLDCMDKSIRETHDKIEQGTLIELPCKVGDTVYTIEKFGWQDRWRVEKNYCNSITFDGDKFFINREVYEYDGCYGYAFGEDAFLTREEAEKRLKELQNG